ncbi:haloacid dehalogenase [Spirochaetia bacterium]|nr:haloacid dehalogenase [Spirochaetia bacterium]
MKVCYLPEQVSALIFDMDLTLYSHPEYGRYQIDRLIERLARIRGVSFEQMNREVTGFQRNWAEAHGGRLISLGNTLISFGISIEESARWREERCEPERYLKADPVLRETLRILTNDRSLALGVVTNNPCLVARKTLAVLGVGDLFPVIVGLDTCMVSKPHEAPFLKAAELLGAPPGECVSIGDRYDIDIALPLELGMGGILVDGVEDVYKLPESFTMS